jgi:AcrR family transcriptional regulator
MGVTERRERQKAALREQILAAAQEIVVAEGFEALTMRRLAQAIEYAPATIYLHFENRDAIAQALAIEGFRTLLGFMEPAGAEPDPARRLAELGRAYVRFGLEMPEAYRLVFMEDAKFMAAAFPEDTEALPDDPGRRVFGLILEALAELRAAGRLRSTADDQALGETFWAALHGIVSLKLTCKLFPATPVEDLMDNMLTALLGGLIA